MGAAGLLIFPIDAEQYNEGIIKLKMDDYPFCTHRRYLPGIETSYVNSMELWVRKWRLVAWV